jgi:hypothetical protein
MELIEEGRTRTVYDRGDGYVVKVAINDEGWIANLRESRWASDYIPVAPCHLDDEGHLVMEKIVRFPGPDEELPFWAGYVDCAQVGYLADGRLVAYDL